jgi:hypothetical protein
MFGLLERPLERSHRGVQQMNGPRPLAIKWVVAKPNKCCLVPQNDPGSLGPEKSWKNCQTEITTFELVE